MAAHLKESFIIIVLLMFENGYLFFLANFMEIVHVELSHERWKFFMLKIFREYLVFEHIFIFNYKTVPIVCPFNDMTILTLLQYSVSLYDEIWYILFAMHLLSSPALLRLLSLFRTTLLTSPLRLFLLYLHAVLRLLVRRHAQNKL